MKKKVRVNRSSTWVCQTGFAGQAGKPMAAEGEGSGLMVFLVGLHGPELDFFFT